MDKEKIEMMIEDAKNGIFKPEQLNLRYLKECGILEYFVENPYSFRSRVKICNGILFGNKDENVYINDLSKLGINQSYFGDCILFSRYTGYDRVARLKRNNKKVEKEISKKFKIKGISDGDDITKKGWGRSEYRITSIKNPFRVNAIGRNVWGENKSTYIPLKDVDKVNGVRYIPTFERK